MRRKKRLIDQDYLLNFIIIILFITIIILLIFQINTVQLEINMTTMKYLELNNFISILHNEIKIVVENNQYLNNHYEQIELKNEWIKLEHKKILNTKERFLEHIADTAILLCFISFGHSAGWF